jgi:Asp/Glu/hydantoin racemase
MISKKVAIVHTSFVSVEYLKNLFREIIPEARLYHIVDDSLLSEVMENGYATPHVVKRVCDYFVNADSLGVDAILNQCSSVGEAADIASEIISTPVIKVDNAMAGEAVRLGNKVAVVATVASTMGPSTRLVQRKAAEAGKTIEIVECLVDGALKILIEEGDRAQHNRLIKEKMLALQDEVDVFVLAQGSMVVLLPELSDIRKPVLSSPRLGVEEMRKVLFNND